MNTVMTLSCPGDQEDLGAGVCGQDRALGGAGGWASAWRDRRSGEGTWAVNTGPNYCDPLYLWICLDRQLHYTLIKYMSSTKLHFNKLYLGNNSCV